MDHPHSVAPKHGLCRYICSLAPPLFIFILKLEIFSRSSCGLTFETHAYPEDEGGWRKEEDEIFGDMGGSGQAQNRWSAFRGDNLLLESQLLLSGQENTHNLCPNILVIK